MRKAFNPLGIKSYSRKQKFLTGFTLIELIVVIAIIAVLAAIIAPNAFRAIEKAKVARVIADAKVLRTAVLALYADTGHRIMDGYSGTHMMLLPGQNPLDTSPLDIVSVYWTTPEGWPGWDGPYVEKVPGMHPWAGHYSFSCWQDFSSPLNGIEELVLEIDDYCYPYPIGPNGGCRMPQSAALKLDAMVDDAEDWPLNTGDVRGSRDIHWILFWDYEDRY
ncbi:MAG: prepilin-type N-terminal cleavage/methylation domain-containing protein [Candidatus Omnitrophica bacterium]|nr:prepilin-type N-terminal cleavage/methylation domain-containing protein [Candidatus Omnitrophota bacterium]MDD5429792.1 prepilin-type N-terminal cleavage/methylation domain-containing protein [Candidatus Omnitrophota bacterium]